MWGSVCIAGVLCLSILTGCADLSNRSQFLSVGMTTNQMQSILGSGGYPKNRVLNQQGQLQELWEYTDAESKQKLWLCFTDYKLSRWAVRGQLLNGVPVQMPSDLIDPIKVP
ncbi:MAG: hypothetical protein LBH01_03700 [Verrucomicrobiales bacterium]|jgi:hypothetical protein|nr:hypothetical protein [Verrucomicrobiales bacterium]